MPLKKLNIKISCHDSNVEKSSATQHYQQRLNFSYSSLFCMQYLNIHFNLLERKKKKKNHNNFTFWSP